MDKKVMVFGVFDGLHKGHCFILDEAEKFGNRLIVVVARDTDVGRYKQKTALHNETDRMKSVQAYNTNATVVLGDEVEKSWGVIREYTPDVIVLGYDQHNLKKSLEEYSPSIEICQLPRIKK